MQQPPWMAHAWAEIGQREAPGAATNPRISGYFRRVGHSSIDSDETAWCAAFVGACLESAGIKSTRSLAARSYLDWGVAANAPSFGAVTVLSRTDDPSLGHVGFLIGETDQQVILLGGNQSNAVSVATFRKTQVLGFRLPSPATITGVSEPSAPPGFDAALAQVLEFEGSWTDDPFDPGGPTNRGITLAVFAREREIELTALTVDHLKAELRQISETEVRHIYLERYWRSARCNDLPAPLALLHFDTAVNQGVGGAARMLQEALDVAVDGEIGPITLAAACSTEPATTIDAYAEIRRKRYRALAHFWRFGRGWLRRVDVVAGVARKLAASKSKSGPPSPLPPSPQSKPAQPGVNPMADNANDFPTIPATKPASSTATPPPPAGKWWGDSLTIWGALLTAVSTVAPAIFAAFGVDLPAELIQKLGREGFAVVQAIAGLVGTVMTILGRIRATLPIERRVIQIRL